MLLLAETWLERSWSWYWLFGDTLLHTVGLGRQQMTFGLQM